MTGAAAKALTSSFLLEYSLIPEVL